MLALVLGFGMLALVRGAVLQETDPYWQVRAGLENISGAPLARPDTWSWAPVDGLFRQTSPLWNDILATAWRTAGWLGLTLAGAASIAGYLAASAVLGRRLGARPLPMLIGATPLLLLAMPMLSPRASLAATSLALLVVIAAPHWIAVVRRTRWAAVLVLVAGASVSWLGSWVHLSWLLLGPLAGTSWMVAAARAPAPRSRRVTTAVAAEVGLVLGAIAGPYGLSVLAYSRSVATASDGLLLEWLTPFGTGTSIRWALPSVVALVGTACGVTQAVWRRHAASSVTAVGLLAVAVPAALAGVTAIRFVGLAILFLVPLAGSWATEVADRAALRAAEVPPRGLMRSPHARFWSDGSRWTVVSIAVLVVLLPLALLASTQLARPPELARLAANLPRGCHLFSDPATASSVILLRPDVRVWTDGRADYWGRNRNAFALQVLQEPDALAPVLDRANCAILLPKAWPTAARAIDADSRWQWLGKANEWQLWVRTS